ncbi:polymer-forming cytoskeletal protein [Deinococcus peraridilitoris]|uniref:Uncharacterized protein n=1 Tax=Deinococcus peraridilitoris (strain DSM 19664 / LMG 22246 / CIP 109416 / KR-200) TaxID=937777 RepID=L0A0F8_DEIPD|nr:polymer-forming cytoskeletal protein [Deinococcus peraridilitoris]AFZ67378.1 hypothetical protein Deipe_1862 [Deinococcus peraridilitoris DSM 19664]
MNSSTRNLMHKALDGKLTTEERQALDTALSHGDVRAEFERLKQVHASLYALPRVSPPPFLAREIAQEISLRAALGAHAPVPESVAARVTDRIAEDTYAEIAVTLQTLPREQLPASLAPLVAARIHRAARHNPAPLVLVGALVAAFVALTVSFAWPNLTAGATVLRELLGQLSPLVFLGFALLLVTSALVTWRPTPAVQRGGSLAFVLSLMLALPSAVGLFAGRAGQDLVRVGGDVVVSGTVNGNVIAIGGNIILKAGARVAGEAVAFLGDVHRSPQARVKGHTSALLGEVEGAGERPTVSSKPLPALGTASAFLPLLEWVSGAAWPRIYLAALGAITLLMFLSGVAPQLARAQRHAPLRTLAMGTLAFSLAVPPLVYGALSGFLVPAFMGGALLLLAFSVGLSVTLYDAGRLIVRRFKVPEPDVLGAVLGLSLFAASMSLPPVAFTLWLLGSCWGAGTLLLARPRLVDQR